MAYINFSCISSIDKQHTFVSEFNYYFEYLFIDTPTTLPITSPTTLNITSSITWPIALPVFLPIIYILLYIFISMISIISFLRPKAACSLVHSYSLKVLNCILFINLSASPEYLRVSLALSTIL